MVDFYGDLNDPGDWHSRLKVENLYIAYTRFRPWIEHVLKIPENGALAHLAKHGVAVENAPSKPRITGVVIPPGYLYVAAQHIPNDSVVISLTGSRKSTKKSALDETWEEFPVTAICFDNVIDVEFFFEVTKENYAEKCWIRLEDNFFLMTTLSK